MMNDSVMNFKAAIAGIVAVLTSLWGWFGWLVIVWVLLMASDWLIGSAAAMRRGEWSSAKLRDGAWHKGGMVIIVCVALTADWIIGTMLANMPGIVLPFDYTVFIGPLVIVWYIVGELGSLAEHAVSMGAPAPAWLSKILDVSKNAIDHAGETIAGSTDEGGEQDAEKPRH